VNDESIRKAAEEAAMESKPITDMRASREYRLGLVKELTYRAITLSIPKNITLE
jgi:xanthine dehydrogenase iron-sulfur cluster and FAD-binding subunit A